MTFDWSAISKNQHKTKEKTTTMAQVTQIYIGIHFHTNDILQQTSYCVSEQQDQLCTAVIYYINIIYVIVFD